MKKSLHRAQRKGLIRNNQSRGCMITTYDLWIKMYELECTNKNVGIRMYELNCVNQDAWIMTYDKVYENKMNKMNDLWLVWMQPSRDGKWMNV